jgi:solute carrier family 45, member 1/2/4
LGFLGLSPSWTAVTLLSGPFCGAVVQPCFGVWSDKCQSSWGRRKPFIIIGTAILIFSILSLAWADMITQAVLAHYATEETKRAVLIIFSLLLTFTMFVAINIVQVGLRAVIIDNCTPLQQSEANTWAIRHANFAGALAYLVAYLDLPWHFDEFGKTRFARTSIPTIIYLAISIAITCLYASDQTQKTSKSWTPRRVTSFQILRSALFGSSSNIRNICLVQFFSWLGWFPFLFYTVTYGKILCLWR